MGFAAAALPALQVAGMAVSAVGAYNSSKANKSAYEAQAQVNQNNAIIAQWQAQDALTRGARAVTASRMRNVQLKGDQRAAMAANGVDLSVGSAQRVLNSTDYIGQLDASTILDNAAREAWGYRTQASNFSASSMSP